MLLYCSQSPEKPAPLQAWQNRLSIPVVSVLFRCQLWQITNCYQLGYGPFCNCLSLTDRTCRWREPHVWPSFSLPYRPTPPPSASKRKHSWCLMPCLMGVMIGCVIAVHHCLAGAFPLRSATNTQTESQIYKFREVQLANTKPHTNTSASELISITTFLRDAAESHVSVYRISSDCMDDLQTIIPIIINGKQNHEYYNWFEPSRYILQTMILFPLIPAHLHTEAPFF